MRRVAEVLMLMLALGAAGAWGQDAPSQQSGPVPGLIPGGAVDTSVQQSAAPAGGYRMEPGMTAPKIVQAVAAVYPEDAAIEGGVKRCVLSMVINPDGVPLFIHPVRSAGEGFDAAAIYAVRQSKFEAGTRDDKGAPIRTIIRVTFTASGAPAIPEILKQTYASSGGGPPVDFPPRVISQTEANYSEQARRKKINGEVIVSTLVSEAGLPTDIRVEQGMGYGLDEKAVESVSQYRFKPAMKDGRPVATRITIEVNFHIY